MKLTPPTDFLHPQAENSGALFLHDFIFTHAASFINLVSQELDVVDYVSTWLPFSTLDFLAFELVA